MSILENMKDCIKIVLIKHTFNAVEFLDDASDEEVDVDDEPDDDDELDDDEDVVLRLFEVDALGSLQLSFVQ